MPDGHPGKGAVVGSTITFSNKIAPYTVGVDVCCRVSPFKLPAEFSVENDLEKFDEVVHACVPTGFNIHSNEELESSAFPYSDLKFWDTLDEARKNITLDEYEKSMKDVYSTTVNIGSIDEAPMVYKDYKEIIDAIKPNAEILCHLREVYNYKDDTKK